MRRTCCPARSPHAIRCWTDAAMMRASVGSWSRRGSYPVATGASMPVSRYPSRHSMRMTHRLSCWTTAAMSVRRWLALEKAGWTTLGGTIKKHPLQEEQVIVHMELEGTATALDKRDRPRVDLNIECRNPGE